MKTRNLAGFAAALGAMVFGGYGTLAAQISDSDDLSNRRSFCAQVRALGNRNADQIRPELSRMFSGLESEISRRKRLVIGDARSVVFDGCKVKVSMNAELKRKIRRDADGFVDVEVTVRNFQILDRGRAARVCVKDPKLKNVKMSRTTRLGEKFYRKFGADAVKRMLETGDCFNITLVAPPS